MLTQIVIQEDGLKSQNCISRGSLDACNLCYKLHANEIEVAPIYITARLGLTTVNLQKFLNFNFSFLSTMRSIIFINIAIIVCNGEKQSVICFFFFLWNYWRVCSWLQLQLQNLQLQLQPNNIKSSLAATAVANTPTCKFLNKPQNGQSKLFIVIPLP